MFGNTKKEETIPNQVATSKNSKGLNSLVVGTTVEGNISADNDFRIDGSLIGNLNGKSKVIIGPEGKVNGEIHCVSAIVEGSFEGTMNISKQLHIKSSAKVQGTINTADLIVESGAKFNVKCAMGRENQGSFKSSNNGEKKVVTTV